jgi:DNA helicase-2/ATP-dependent DNA helicase PcrA
VKDFLEDLNPAQRRAVLHGEGPLLVIAGAGTGKTKVLTRRIAHLVASKMARPEEILAVTFTEKAAGEMEERVDVLVPYTASYVEIRTFNSFGERILRDFALEIGAPPDFKLLDDVEQAIFVRENLFRLPLDHYRPLSTPTRYIQELLETIRRLKQEDVKPGRYLEYAEKGLAGASGDAEKETAVKHREIARVFEAYQGLLRGRGMIDFEDQVTLVVDLFRSRPSVLKEVRDRYRYILVDEFQDTNSIQFELLKMLAAEHRNLTVVGDDDQSIFRFRGASLGNILGFQEVYPDARKIVLVRNYRSAQPILDAAYRLIQHNNPDRLEVKFKVDKRLKAQGSPGPDKCLFMLSFDSVSHEADGVADLILERHARGSAWGDMAVLIRRNADADPYLRSFNVKQIPFRFSGSRGLYQQEVVKVLIAFIKALTDFEDSRALFYLAMSDVGGMGAYDLTRLSNLSQARHVSLHRIFREIQEGKSPVEISEESANAVRKVMDDLLFFVDLSRQRNAGAVVYSFLERSGLLRRFVESLSVENELAIKNVRLFFDKIKGFSDLVDDDSIQSFSRYLDLLQDVGDNPPTAEADLDEDAVNILTVHKSKGLEFEAVFMAGLIEDRYPGRAKREKIPVPTELLRETVADAATWVQEERRLFYVAMTRAKKVLTLTWGRDYGRERLKKVSPFVLEALDIARMPDDVLEATTLEEIRRFRAPVKVQRVRKKPAGTGFLTLSYVQVEDYLLCPLKYRFRHLLRVPVLPHHTLVFGRVLHATVHEYLESRMRGRDLGEDDVLGIYESNWVNEGFLSREHEELRKAAGSEALRRFVRMEEESGRIPARLEKSFRWREKAFRFVGRWDRIDIERGGLVITDFKTGEVQSPKEADRRAAESLQLDIYALALLKTEGVPPVETRLHFLESGLIGRATKGEAELRLAGRRILEVERGVRAEEFSARPDWQACSSCEFKTICPSSYAY